MKEYIIKANVSGKLADECLNVLNASELVRCKDCKHNNPFGCDKHNVIVSDIYFCADGERKEENQD